MYIIREIIKDEINGDEISNIPFDQEHFAVKFWHENAADHGIKTPCRPFAGHKLKNEKVELSYHISDETISEPNKVALIELIALEIMRAIDGGLGEVGETKETAERLVDEWVKTNNIFII